MGFKCACGITFNDVYALARHIQFKHFIEEDGKIRYWCTSASCKPFAGSNHILEHFVAKHLEDEGMQFLVDYQEESTRKRLKSTNPVREQARVEPVEYPSLSDYHDLGLDHFTSEDVVQLHEEVSVDEPTADQAVSHQPSDFVPIFKVNLAQRDFDDEFSERICQQRKQYSATDKTIFGLAKEWLAFYQSCYETGQLNNKFFESLSTLVDSPYTVERNVLDNHRFGEKLKENLVEINDESFKFYYLPIETTIKQLLASPIAMKHIFADHKALPNDQFYRSAKDGLLHKPSSDKLIVLKVQLYFDDFSLTPRNTNTKLCVGYFTIMNLPYWMQSSTDEIYTCLIMKRKDLNVASFSAFLEPLIKDLIRVKTEFIELDGGYKVQIELQSVVADNLGSNELSGVCKGFTGDACRFCDKKLKNLKFDYEAVSEESIYRVRTVNNSAFRLVTVSPYLFPYDLFHDFACNGIIQRVMGPIFKRYYIEAANQTGRNDLKRFENLKSDLFKRFDLLTKDRISDVSKQGVIEGKGCQVIEFFLLFGFLDEIVPRESDLWKLYISIRNIYLFVSAELIPRDKLNDFQAEVNNFLNNYIEFIVKANLESFVFKIHYLFHYKRAIEHFGPLALYSTVKYEREHQVHKRGDANSNQFKNKALSLAKRCALGFQLDFNVLDYEIKKEIKFQELNSAEHISYRHLFQSDSNVVLLKWLKLEKVFYKKNLVFRLVSENLSDPPEFVKILLVAKQGENFYVVATKLKTLDYKPEKVCFKVEHNCEVVKLTNDMIHHHQLVYSSRHSSVLKSFYLNSDF